MNDQEGVTAPAQYRYRFGSAEFDEARFELRVDGVPVEVERRALEVLACLLRHAGEVVTKDELFAEVWSGRITVDKVLPNAVMKLRRALGGDNAQLLVSLPRIGYRLTGVTERVAVGRRLSSRLELAAGQAVPQREHFRLVRQLGTTRSSEVWLAVHSKTREARVYKFAADASRLGALKREATLSRVLQESLGEREDFSRVIDWNFSELPYFLECAYGGQNLLEWADDASRPLASMDVPQRIALFLNVVDAVAAAHSVGVLHKDLKPANILIAARGDGWQVRLTDFGSGRLLEPGRLEALGITQLGLTLTQKVGGDSSTGTPLYLAPELLTGQAPTVQSDVYALGIMLYQVLVADFRRPLSSGWEQDIADPLLRADIAAAAQGDLARRLTAVSELASRLRDLNLRRVREQEQLISARRVQEAERRLQAARARRPWIAAASLALLAGTVGSLWFAWEARANLQTAREQTVFADAVVRFLEREVLGAANPAYAAPGEVTVRDALAAAEQRLSGRLAGQPVLEGRVRTVLSSNWLTLGDMGKAVDAARQAYAKLRDNLGLEHPLTRRAAYQLAEGLTTSGQFDPAKGVLDEADHYASRNDSDDLVRASAINHGLILLMSGHSADAVPHYQRALQAQLHLDSADLPAVVGIKSNLAQSLMFGGQFEAADELYRDILSTPDPDRSLSFRLSYARLLYGESLLSQQKASAAEPLLTQACAELESQVGPDNYRTLKCWNVLASLHAERGRWQDALDLGTRTYEALVRKLGASNHNALGQLANIGMYQFYAGHTEAGVDMVRRARDQLLATSGNQNMALVQCMGMYAADLALQTAAFDQAEALLREGLDPAAIEQICPGDHAAPRLRGIAGGIALHHGQGEQGVDQLESALAELEREGAPEVFSAHFRRLLADAGPRH